MKCAVTDCSSLQEDGFRTCSNPDHRRLEQAYFSHGQGIFKLCERLKKAGVILPSNSLSEETPVHDAEAVVEAAGGLSQGGITVLDDPVDVANCDGKPDGGNRKLWAFFGRRRTHNEQLLMRPCGVIIAHATFFGSEVVSAVNVRSILQIWSSDVLFLWLLGVCKGCFSNPPVYTRVSHIRQQLQA